MRTLSSGMATEVAKVVTSPGYLVEILFSTPLHFSSRGQINWSGTVWLARDIDVKGIAVDGTGSAKNGAIDIGDTDSAMAAVLLLQGISDRTVNVWAFYSDDPGATDPVPIFAGAGDEWAIDESRGSVSITVRQFRAATAYSPRIRITPERGFNFLPAAGSTIKWAGEVFTIEQP